MYDQKNHEWTRKEDEGAQRGDKMDGENRMARKIIEDKKRE